jgi:hypothetical protein
MTAVLSWHIDLATRLKTLRITMPDRDPVFLLLLWWIIGDDGS